MILSRPRTLWHAYSGSLSKPEAALPHMSLVLITVAWPFSHKLFTQGRPLGQRFHCRLPELNICPR